MPYFFLSSVISRQRSSVVSRQSSKVVGIMTRRQSQDQDQGQEPGPNTEPGPGRGPTKKNLSQNLEPAKKT